MTTDAAISVEGLLTHRSAAAHGPTLARLKSAIASAGLTLFAHIDQAAAARTAGLVMPPMDLLVFGNPKAGTPLMLASPTVGIDLPLKALVWQNAKGQTWIAFNDPAQLASRHDLPNNLSNVTVAMSHMQAGLASFTTAGEPGGKH